MSTPHPSPLLAVASAPPASHHYYGWRGALGATLLVLLAAYAWLLPAATGWLAAALPPALERQLGEGVLAEFDRSIFQPSTLPLSRQQELAAEFGRLLPPRAGAPAWRLLFRHSRIGPFASALPSGVLVLSDEMVALLPDDAGLMALLAHELGHLHGRHLSRVILQHAGWGASARLLCGDASALLAALPALAPALRYEPAAEREADEYALAMLGLNGIALRHLAEAYALLRQAALRASPQGGAGPVASYLERHPASAERMAQIRAAQR